MEESTLSEAQPAIVAKWRVHLAQRHPRRAVVAMFFVAASAAIAYLVWHHALIAMMAGFLVFLAVAEFLLPVSYSIGPDGVWCRNFLSLRHLRWSEIKRCYRDAEGIKLSPLARPSRLEAYRGIYLWLGDDAATVVEAIAHYLRKDAPS